VLGAIAWMVVRVPGERPELAELSAALAREPHRPLQARLIGLAYAPPAQSRTGTSGGGARVGPEVTLAAAKLERAASQHPSARTRGAFAVARLALGDIDAAITDLEDLVGQPAATAAMHNDLAGAYLARAQQDRRAADVARALATVERARSIDGSSAAILFTRALALDALHLEDAARAAWRDYLRTVPADDGWSREAQAQLASLDRVSRREQWTTERQHLIDAATAGDRIRARGIVSTFREATREWLDDELLPQMAEGIVAGREDVGLQARVPLIAATLSDLTQDRLATQTVAALIGAGAARARIAHGHVLWRDARRAAYAYRFAEAATLFARCEQELDAGRTPFVIWAQFQRAVAEYQLRHLDLAQSLLQRVLAVAEPAGYHGAAGRARWVLGSIQSNVGAFTEADAAFRQARREFEAAGDRENVANVDNLLAENFGWLGEQDEGWARLVSALDLFDALRDPRRRQAMMYVGGVLAVRQRLPEVALIFQSGYLDAAREAGVSASVAEGLVRRAETFQQLAASDRARRDLDEARTLAAVADASQADWILALASEVEGEMWRGDDPTRSRQAIDAAIAYAQRANRTNRLPTLYLARGRTNRTLDRPAEAETDYRRGLTVFEQLHRGIAAESARLAFFDRAWDLYADATDLLASTSRMEEALAIAESGRARDLTAQVAAAPFAAADLLPRVRAALDAQTSILFYSSLDARLLIWVVRHDDVHLVARPIRAAQLERRVDECRTRILDGNSDNGRAPETYALTACASLYREVIEPVEPFLATGGRLLIVPDGGLHALPFAALETPRGQYLVAEHPVASVPNLTFVARAAAMAGAVTGRGAAPATHALIVGNPALHGEAVSGLPSLTYAAREARVIRALYPSATWLEGEAATRSAFVQAIADADVVHFAGHAVPAANFPGLSRLVFGPPHQGEPSEGLTAREIATLRTSHPLVVVLAACRTAAGSMRYRAEGPMSLARPFLAAGAQSVVGTLWDVDDYASSVFFTSFHTALVHGARAPDALQQAQRSLMLNSNPALRRPAAWAGMVVYGW
jgi:CHAT domain-containing protein